MDETDVRIFCEMADRGDAYNILTDRLPSTGGIARQLGLDEKTIRARVRGMEEEGFIQYYQADPHPILFGLDAVGVYRFETVNIATKRNLVEAIRAAHGVVEAHEFLGPTAVVQLAGKASEGTRAAAELMARRFELSIVPLGEHRLDATATTLDRLDWRIARALRYDARRSTHELAHEVGITERMAEYRVRKLLDARALRVRAVLDSQRQHGLVFYELEIALDEPWRTEIVHSLRSVFGERLWSMQRSTPGLLLVNLFAFTLEEPESALLKAQELPGVRRVALYIQKSAIEPRRPSWIDSELDVRAADPSTASGGNANSAGGVRPS